MSTMLNRPAEIAEPYRAAVLVFLREYVDLEVQKLRDHFGIELDPAEELPRTDEDYLRLPIAQSCARFALVAAGDTRGLKQKEIWAQVQDLLDKLFNVPTGNMYEMMPSFWLSDFGNIVLLAYVWSRNIELITVTEAVELTGRPYDYFTHAVQRGKLSSYPDIREPNPQRRMRLEKRQVLALARE